MVMHVKSGEFVNYEELEARVVAQQAAEEDFVPVTKKERAKLGRVPPRERFEALQRIRKQAKKLERRAQRASRHGRRG